MCFPSLTIVLRPTVNGSRFKTQYFNPTRRIGLFSAANICISLPSWSHTITLPLFQVSEIVCLSFAAEMEEILLRFLDSQVFCLRFDFELRLFDFAFVFHSICPIAVRFPSVKIVFSFVFFFFTRDSTHEKTFAFVTDALGFWKKKETQIEAGATKTDENAFVPNKMDFQKKYQKQGNKFIVTVTISYTYTVTRRANDVRSTSLITTGFLCLFQFFFFGFRLLSGFL